MTIGLIEKTIERVLLGNGTSDDHGSQHKIVICQRGFIYAGDVDFRGEYLVIRDAVNLRKWGTTHGLGDLARSGNRPETIADACGVVRVHQLAVVATIDCEVKIHATT